MMKWIIFIISNLILYPCFKNIWREIDRAKEEERQIQEKKIQQQKGLMRDVIQVDLDAEEVKMIELISWNKGYFDLKDKQALRKIIIENIN